MGISKVTSSVLMCALMLVLILELAQVEGKSCCKTTAARLCYNGCRRVPIKPPRKVCAKLCNCKIQSSSLCKPPYPIGFNLLPPSEEPVSIQDCSMGCRSSVCANMLSNDDVDGGTNGMMETIVERCAEGCDQFCEGNASIASSVAA